MYDLTNDQYGTPEGQSDPGVEDGVSVHHPLYQHLSAKNSRSGREVFWPKRKIGRQKDCDTGVLVVKEAAAGRGTEAASKAEAGQVIQLDEHVTRTGGCGRLHLRCWNFTLVAYILISSFSHNF